MNPNAQAPQVPRAAIPGQPFLALTHWRYILLDNGVGAAFLNFGINAAIAWLTFKHAAVVPLWGAVGMATDTIATSFILPIITCVVVTALTGWHVRAGRLPQLPANAQQHAVVRWLPRTTGRRAVVTAFVSLVLLAPLTVGLLSAIPVDAMPFRDFVLFKAAFAVVNGLLVTPPLALAALAQASRRAIDL